MLKACYAILIDGGFAKYALKPKASAPPISEVEIRKLIDVIGRQPCVADMRLHRVYFYDAKPLTGKFRRPDGKEFDFSSSPLAKISSQQHASFARIPYVAMRYGELSFRGWSIKEKVLRATKAVKQIAPDDLGPNVQQKGVDMRIGMDIAALSLKKQAQVIVLVTGDSDLVPAMKFARREGVQVVLVRLGQNVKDSMLDHADVVIDQGASDLLKG